MPAVGAAVVAALASGCGPAPLLARVDRSAGPAPLNATVVVDLGASLDPLSVTERAVRAEDESGRRLDAVLDGAGGRLTVRLVIDAVLLESPPATLRLRLAGEPSPHALRALDGRRLPAPTTLAIPLDPVLEADGTAPRLVAIDGLPVESVLERGLPPRGPDGLLSLTYDGPLDPAAVVPRSCPLVPVAEGLDLQPLLPAVTWRCVGSIFRLDVVVPRSPHALRARLAEWGLKGPHGHAPRPAPELRLGPSR